MENNAITKKQSAQLQGIAILLMIYHHFFNDLTIYGESLVFAKPEWVVRFAWFGKICVGVFAFVSGYGMCKVLERKKEGHLMMCLRQILGLLLRYWAVLLLFMGLFFELGKRTFDFQEFVLNFFCIETSYNGAFWYVQEYVILMLLLVLLDGFLGTVSLLREKGFHLGKLDKKGIFTVLFYGILILAGLLWLALSVFLPGPRSALGTFLDVIRIAFVLIFFVGFCLAKTRILDKALTKLVALKTVLRVLTGIALITLVMAARMVLADSAAYARADFVLVPIFATGLLLLFSASRLVSTLFERIGSLCAYLWLTHLFVYDLTMGWILGITKNHLIFWLLELIPCFLVAYAFWLGEDGCKRIFGRIKKRK
ncbi:MAG: acyltransferase family protein [Lachnospiraceae bacterium]|nr:acyltransferase family protein [Lachnospiraceae bacterium]